MVCDITVSKVLSDTVSSYKKTNVITERVGHSFIKRTMKDSGAILGVEKSGHFYFGDLYRADSGVMAMLYLLRHLSERGTKLKDEVQPLRDGYFLTGQINLTIEGDPSLTLERVKERYKDKKVEDLDGISVSSDGWRFVIRSSNTEPVVRLVAEASSKNILNEKIKEVIKIINPSSVSYPS